MPDSAPPRVTVIGIGADGWRGLPAGTQRRLEAATVVLGATRQLGLLPEISGQERRAWGSPFDLAVLDEYAGRDVVVLASGDPMLSGIGSRLAGNRDVDLVEVVPAVSSVTLAHARLGWDALATSVVTLVGRAPERVLRHLSPGRRILVLSSDATTPATLGRLLDGVGYGASRITVLGDLGTEHETQVLLGPDVGWKAPALNIVAIECPPTVERSAAVGSWSPGLPDDAYEHDGQLTKRDLRASALARLAPQPQQLLWDVGAGAGSVGIEWMRAYPDTHAMAFEVDDERRGRIRRNAIRLGVPDLITVPGRAPESLSRAHFPHAIFVGGGATEPTLLATCVHRLLDGGRLVVHGVTLETEHLLRQAHATHGGELTRHAVEYAEPLGSFLGWRPARTVTQWFWTKSGPATGERHADWTIGDPS